MPRSIEPHQCRYCGQVLTTKGNRDKHEQHRHMKCTTCAQTFSSTKDLRKQLGDLGRCPRGFPCMVMDKHLCNEVYFSQEALDAHELEARPGKLESCPTCRRKFRALYLHLKKGVCGTERRQKAMTCDNYKHEFSALRILERHTKRGCKGKISYQATKRFRPQLTCPFASKGCNVRSYDKVGIALHIEIEHRAPTNWFRCTVPDCRIAVSEKPLSAREMKGHMQNHERAGGTRRFSADSAPVETSAPQHHHFDKLLSADEVLAILDEMDKAEESSGALGIAAET